MKQNWTLLLTQNYRLLMAFGMLVIMFIIFISLHPAGFSMYVLTIWANQGVALSFVAIAQTLVVLTSGLDLSVGAVMALTNAITSELVDGNIWQVTFGTMVVLLTGSVCGLLNGIIVVYGRIQPIIVTLATGAVYTGLALFIRPISGGHVSETLSNALTYDIMGIVPTSLVLLFGVVLVIWVPLKGSLIGRGIYAIGSSESAAYMSGVKSNRSKLVAYTLCGLFASLGGIFIGLQTLTGDANIGFSYTLNSVASVVIGGTLLSGGAGGVIGSIIGAFVLRTVNSLMFFAGAPPLAQPLFEGLILLSAVSLGAIHLIRLRNRLDVIGS